MRCYKRKYDNKVEPTDKRVGDFCKILCDAIYSQRRQRNCLSKIEPIEICRQKINKGRKENPNPEAEDLPSELAGYEKPVTNIRKNNIASGSPRQRINHSPHHEHPDRRIEQRKTYLESRCDKFDRKLEHAQ